MITASLSKILETNGLERFRPLLESDLKLTSLPQLLKHADLRRALLGIGMSERETETLRQALENQTRSRRPEKIGPQPIRTRQNGSGHGSFSVPTSPAGDLPPNLIGRPLTYPSSVPSPPLKSANGEPEISEHPQRCTCETCCNKRNDEYVIWFKADELPTKKSEPLTRPSERETADDVTRALEIIYTEYPNKFAVPNGAAVSLRAAQLQRQRSVPEAPDRSPTSSDFERTPPRPGLKISLPWKSKTPPNPNRSTNQQEAPTKSKSFLARKPSFGRQKSQEEGPRTKAGGSTPASGSGAHLPSRFTRLQEVFGKKRNKLSLRIHLPEDEDSCRDLKIKPMSANEERKMREALEEIVKFRNNNSPKSPLAGPPGKGEAKGSPSVVLPGDSPCTPLGNSPTNRKDRSSSFKFPQFGCQDRTRSVVASNASNNNNNNNSNSNNGSSCNNSSNGDRSSPPAAAANHNHNGRGSSSCCSSSSCGSNGGGGGGGGGGGPSSRVKVETVRVGVEPRPGIERSEVDRLSSVGSTGSQRSLRDDHDWRRRLKIKSCRRRRLSGRATSECRPRLPSGSGSGALGAPFSPYDPGFKSRSVEFVTRRKKTDASLPTAAVPTTAVTGERGGELRRGGRREDDLAVLRRLTSNPLLRCSRPGPKIASKQRSLSGGKESSTEFVIRFESALSLGNEGEEEEDRGRATLNEEEAKGSSPPPPAVPPRVPIKQPTCPLSIRDSISRKRSSCEKEAQPTSRVPFEESVRLRGSGRRHHPLSPSQNPPVPLPLPLPPLRSTRPGFEREISRPLHFTTVAAGCGNTCPSRGRFSRSEKERSEAAARTTGHPTAVFCGPLGGTTTTTIATASTTGSRRFETLLASRGATAAFKSCDWIPKRRSPDVVLRPYRFSADAAAVLLSIDLSSDAKGKMRRKRGRERKRREEGEKGKEEQEEEEEEDDDVTISNSSSECNLDESTSYEDLMEQALDSNPQLNEDAESAGHPESQTPLNCTRIPAAKCLEVCEWTIPEVRKRSTADAGETVVLSPRSGRAVLVGHF